MRSMAHELQIEHILAERVDRCSSGMIQQLAFARSLIGSPVLLLLDEPTRSLDESACGRLWQALARRSHVAVLIATHRRRGPRAMRLTNRASPGGFVNEDAAEKLAEPDGSRILMLDDPELFNYPIAFMWEPGFWNLDRRGGQVLSRLPAEGRIRGVRGLRRGAAMGPLRGADAAGAARGTFRPAR